MTGWGGISVEIVSILIHSPRQPSEIRFPEERRAPLVAALREQNGDSPALERLAQPGCVAVVTGQQVGLFSGPAYTIFKALTAVKLAKHLSDQGIAAVPVFWLATEDHDLAEVDHAWVFDDKTTPRRIPLKDSGNTGWAGRRGEAWPSSLRRIGIGLGRPALRRRCTGTGSADAYCSGATLGAAFRNLVRGILRDFDLLYLDPLAPAVRSITAPFLAEAVHQVPDLTEALRRRNDELTRDGYHAQVHIEENSSLLFVIRDGKRAAAAMEGWPLHCERPHILASRNCRRWDLRYRRTHCCDR